MTDLLRRQYDEMVSENARLQALLAERDAEVARLETVLEKRDRRIYSLELTLREIEQIPYTLDGGTEAMLDQMLTVARAALAGSRERVAEGEGA